MRQNTVVYDDETDWEEVAGKGNRQAKQTAVYQEIQVQNMHCSQNVGPVAYFYLFLFQFF